MEIRHTTRLLEPGWRGQYPLKYKRRFYAPPERYLEEPPRENPTQMQWEVEELRQHISNLYCERQPQQAEGSGTAQQGQGTGSNRQALRSGGVLGSERVTGREPAVVSMIETKNIGMLSSALEDMHYEDVLQWEGGHQEKKSASRRTRRSGRSGRTLSVHIPLATQNAQAM